MRAVQHSCLPASRSSAAAPRPATHSSRRTLWPCFTASRGRVARNLSCACKGTDSTDGPSKEPSPQKPKDEESQEDSNFRDMADRELGPLLQSMGIDAEPSAFLDEVVSLATALQLLTCGLMFWGLQLYADWSTTEALRAAIGMAVGLVIRPTLETELLFLPLYSDIIQLLSPVSMTEVGPTSEEKLNGVLNTVGALLFVGFLVPQALFHWTAGESLQLVAPMAAGWVVFDLAYMIAFLVKIRVI